MTRKVYPPRGGGDYRAWNPAVKRVVSLGTTDADEAQRRAEAMWAAADVVRKPFVELPGERQAPAAEPAASPQPSVDARSVLESWATGGVSPQPPKDAGSFVSAPPNATSERAPSPVIPIDTARRGPGRPPKAATGLTPEQAAKLGSGLTKLVTKINVIAAEVCVQLMGRDPFPLDDDELQLLAMGWEMFLEEYFVKHKPKPWMLIAAGNCMMIFAMYMKGTPRARAEEPDMVPGVGSAVQ